MRKLPVSFMLLTFSGFWRPTEWPARSFKSRLYNIYSAIMISVLHTYSFSCLLECVSSEDLDTLTYRISLLVSIAGVSLKVTNLFLQREKIINVVNILLKENCLPQNEQEATIQQMFDNYTRKLTIYCEILNEGAALFGIVVQMQTASSSALEVPKWIPRGSSELYRISIVHSIFGLMMCANASVGNETLLAGLMIEVGAQFRIFCNRLQNVPALIMEAESSNVPAADLRNRRKEILKNIVEYHLEIYKFARTVNTVFQHMILLQFSISSTVLCLTIYRISTVNLLSIKFIWGFTYLCCMLVQIYLYCWFGNEVMIESQKVCDAIYEMNWTILPANIVKDFLIIMARSMKPLKMTSYSVIILSAESFMGIMKIAYSSYNLLKDSSNDENVPAHFSKL